MSIFEFKFGPLSGLVGRFEFVLELFFADFGEELAHGGAGFHAHGEQVVAGEQRRANFRLFRKFSGLVNQVIVNVQTAMGAKAIEAMELEFKREGGAHQHPAEGGFAHLQCIFKLHMATHRSDDIVGLYARETETFENLLGHICADALVFVKVDAAGLRVAGRGERFGDVVKENRPRQGWVSSSRKIFEHQEQVVENGSFGMKIGRLVASDGGGDFGKDLFEQAALAKKIEAARRVGWTEKFDEFVADALGTDRENLWRDGFDGGEGFGLDIEIELGGETYGPQ